MGYHGNKICCNLTPSSLLLSGALSSRRVKHVVIVPSGLSHQVTATLLPSPDTLQQHPPILPPHSPLLFSAHTAMLKFVWGICRVGQSHVLAYGLAILQLEAA